MNNGKNKDRQQKKTGLLKGIGHMFRFGKNRKDVFPAQSEIISDYGGWSSNDVSKSSTLGPTTSAPSMNTSAVSQLQVKPQQQQPPREQRESSHERQLSVNSNGHPPPLYQPPPPVANGQVVNGSKITQNDAFNHRYSHYVNYDELQMQIR